MKHLDHQNIVKQPLKQINIIHVITQLAQNAKKQASVAITGALTDLLRHLRKCMQYSAEASSAGTGADKLNSDLLLALEKCISQLSDKVCNLMLPYPCSKKCNILLIIEGTTVTDIYENTNSRLLSDMLL